MCCEYNLDAEQFVTSWVTYAANHSYNEIKEQYLDTFERDNLKKSVSKPNKFQPTESHSPLRVDTIEQLQAESDILLTYGASPTSNVSHVYQFHCLLSITIK